MTELLFIRHGQTPANAAGAWQGWSDPPLNATGQAQAHAIADRLKIDHSEVRALYTSPLRRALQTAEIIGTRLALSPHVVHQLKEIHFGDLEGITLEEMEDRFPELHARWQDKTDMTFQWPGGEQRGDFFARAAEACERICSRHYGEKVVIVAHGGTIRACLAHLLPDQLGQWWRYSLDNTGLSRVRLAEGNARLIALNDASHLSGQAPG